MPMLKVRYISISPMPPVSCSQRKMAGTSSGSVMENPYPESLEKFRRPPPVMWHMPWTVQASVTRSTSA